MNCILLPAADITANIGQIHDTGQIKHIKDILGATVGDTLKIGQLEGNLGTAIIEEMTAEKIQLGDVKLTNAPPKKLDVTVILALPRPKVLRRLIMDMTALGVRDIILINSYRTQKSYWQSPLLARLDEFVLEGLQQGVDTIAPRIRLQKRFKPFVEDELASLITGAAIVAHPYSELSLNQCLNNLNAVHNEDTIQLNGLYKTSKPVLPSVVCIGAEGGWIDYEIALLTAHGCLPVNIGSRILRTEAAVNVILGQWLLHSD